ncbi:hypothetical protein B566_EDAN003671 [Ephemera danica]|nr:hypothetical protein B566_EDAN003671 [Ephemera danica]
MVVVVVVAWPSAQYHLRLSCVKSIQDALIPQIRKPLMEKKRRARINDCLNELKRMLLDADAELKQPGSRPTKLEKADILELTVRHVRRLQREARSNHDSSSESSEDSSSRFRAGFSECAREVQSELSRLELGDEALRERLESHLFSCLNNPRSTVTSHFSSTTDDEVSSSSGSSSPPPGPPSPPIFVQQRKGYTLVPTKLPNGDLAFVIPAELRHKCNTSPVLHPKLQQTSQSAPLGPVWRPW